MLIIEPPGVSTDTLRIRIQSIKGIIAIAHAAPAPVEVKIALAVIAVTHERVSALRRGLAVDNHRTDIFKVVIDHLGPFARRIDYALMIAAIDVIVKIITQGRSDDTSYSAGSTRPIVHGHRISASLHKV